MGLFATIRHIRALAELKEKVAEMERTVRGLETEWMETYDNNRRILGKIAKRAKFVEKHEAEAEATPPSAVEPLPDGMSASQAAANREILTRRRLMGVR